MAFATKGLRILCKVYNGGKSATYFTLRPRSARATFVQAALRCYSSDGKTPKITENLTNIPTKLSPMQSVAQEFMKELVNEEEARRQEEEEKVDREKAWRMMKFSFLFFGVTISISGAVLAYLLGRPKYDENGKPMEDEFSKLPIIEQFYKRLLQEIRFYKRLIQEPSSDKLLPDPLKYPYIQPPYTLVLEMTDVLVHPDWTYQTGWRFKKRPGLDQFFEAVAPPQFEIVVYTAEQGMTVFPILDALDPKGYIMYRLVRDATKFVDGHHVKDLDALNRDLTKVIVVDWNQESVKFHPENTLKLPRWTGNDDDRTLYDLAAFLKTVLASNVEDVRTVLNYYRQFDNPLEAFRENQRKLLLQMQEDEQKAQKEGNKALTKWKPTFLRSH